LALTDSACRHIPVSPLPKTLSGVAVATGDTVVVGDVSKDPRYLTAFGSTRSEIIVPIVGRAGRKVVGTIDVESENVDASS
jgi:L-methionine (R)-S-oxide reductase